MTGPRYIDSSTAGSLPSNVDVLIVGSGPVGATYARLVAERAPHAHILMVEAGPRLTDVAGVHVRNIIDDDERARAIRLSEGPQTADEHAHMTAHFDAATSVPAPAAGTSFVNPDAVGDGAVFPAAAMSRNVGGMGCHWAAATPSPRGRERIGFIPDDEWERALAVGKRLLAIHEKPRTGTPEWEECLTRLGTEFNAELPADGHVRNMPVAYQNKPDGRGYWTGTDVVLGDLASQPRDTFAIAAGTICRELFADGHRVGGAVLENLTSGQVSRVSAKAVIAAGDSLHTPQLLWASGIRPRPLGHYLNDHMMVGSLMTPDYLDTPDDPSLLYAPTRPNAVSTPSARMSSPRCPASRSPSTAAARTRLSVDQPTSTANSGINPMVIPISTAEG